MKILVIEDEHKIAGAIKKGLEQEGFVVQISYNGMEGFDLASTEEYSVIILDLMLPKMDGLTLCKRLREDERLNADSTIAFLKMLEESYPDAQKVHVFCDNARYYTQTT